jgi:hypothetical protein
MQLLLYLYTVGPVVNLDVPIYSGGEVAGFAQDNTARQDAGDSACDQTTHEQTGLHARSVILYWPYATAPG